MVGEACGGDKPSSNHVLVPVGAEEIVEESGVDGLDGLLLEVVVVGHDLRCLVLVRVLDQGFNQAGVSLAELGKANIRIAEQARHLGNGQSVQLLSLVSEAVLLNHNLLAQVVKESSRKVVLHVKRSYGSRVVFEQGLSFVRRISV